MRALTGGERKALAAALAIYAAVSAVTLVRFLVGATDMAAPLIMNCGGVVILVLVALTLRRSR